MVHFRTLIVHFRTCLSMSCARVLLRTEGSREQCWESRCKGMIIIFWYVFILL